MPNNIDMILARDLDTFPTCLRCGCNLINNDWCECEASVVELICYKCGMCDHSNPVNFPLGDGYDNNWWGWRLNGKDVPEIKIMEVTPNFAELLMYLERDYDAYMAKEFGDDFCTASQWHQHRAAYARREWELYNPMRPVSVRG